MKKINKNELISKKYNRLIIIDILEVENHRRYCICKCDCGNIKKMLLTAVVNSKSKSCGCLAKELHPKKHSLSNSRIYTIYSNMKSRCYNKNRNRYKNYGGRGIIVCNEWLGNKGFENFYNWAINNGYQDNLTLDRINVNDNYKPNNCRWITLQEQSNNRQNSRIFNINGKKMNLKDISKKYNIPWTSLYTKVIYKNQSINDVINYYKEGKINDRSNKRK